MRGAVIVLAAGKSERMGSPKQLLPYRGRPLAAHAIGSALDSGIGPVVVVSGAVDLKVELGGIDNAQNRDQTPLIWVRNENWAAGIAGSIKAGLTHLLQLDDKPEAVLIMVADQPHADADLLKQLWQLWEGNEQSMAACGYDGIMGTPAVFGRSRFEALLALSGDAGARKILLTCPEDVVTLTFPAGAIDIDTPEDYEKLKQ